MGKMITGSIDLTKILEAAKAKHSAFSKAESNGHIYMNVLIWENDEPDKFQNNFSVQLNAVKDAPETERKNYIGNLKYAAANQTPVTTEEIPEASDLPF